MSFRYKYVKNLWSFQVRSVCPYGFTRVEPPSCYPPPSLSVPGIEPSNPGRESCVLCACATFPPCWRESSLHLLPALVVSAAAQ